MAGTAFTPLAIHAGEDVAFASKAKAEVGITGQMLIDYDNELLYEYQRVGDSTVVFPLAYLVDADGIIANIYVDTEPALNDLLETIEAILP